MDTISTPTTQRRRRGLGAWLALAFSLLTVVLTLLLVQVVERSSTEQVKDSIGHGLGELARQTADKLDRGMFERYREVSLMAGRRDLRDPGTPPAERRRILADMRETYGYYDWIGLTALDGRVIVEARGLLEGVDVSQRPWFRNALEDVHVGDVHEAVKLARLLPSENGEPRRFVDVAFPFQDLNGKTAGVLGVHLSWQWARDVERSIIAPVQERGRVQALIVSRQGVVLLGPPGLQGKKISTESLRLAQQKRTGYRVEQWDDGVSYLVGYGATVGRRMYPGLGWTVLVRQDIDDAYAPVRRLREQALWSGAALAVVFSLAGLLVARRITRPLGALAESAERLRRGEAVQLVPNAKDYYEVQALSGTLNHLVSDLVRQRAELRDLNATLEQRVEERTRELERALASVQASEQRINAIVDAAQDAYIAVDQRGMILDWNRAAERMFGWRRQEAVGWPLSELVLPERYRASLNGALHAFRQTGQLAMLEQRLEREVIDRHGREFTIEMTATLAGQGEDAFFSVFLHDISGRKRVEQMKNEFVATVSHELRTPLTSIQASLSMLADGMAGDLPPDAARLIAIASQSSERLVRMVNDLLDIQKIEAGQMHFQHTPQPLLPVFERALAAMEGQARQAAVILRRDWDAGAAGLAASIDPDRMEQVLTNLLSNAIKFTPAGKSVTLGLARTADMLRLSVLDEGPGIAPAFQARVFQRFAQADGADSRTRGGTGLGLAISKAIIEEHGGSIGFDTAPGRGTRFVIELPVAATA
ncbi:PAS domain S-box protein [Massilia sp. IC2-477]|uniref:ATP-binding protein n=1 Tax=Massilia sp. IC2-477 TaxID=2887198 RepID=UPI001D11C2F3|nr:ATP-binding protein [Massilia sp. IC2-477]MCC2955726.1 PAS domain S-box protein [Massilia sp. IC2-477]